MSKCRTGALRARALLCCCAALLLAACAAPGQEKSASAAVQATSEQTASGGVGDPRTRAKLHTELAALYFQDGNMAVALDETAIALAAQETYAPAYNVRGLINHYLRETGQAARDFERALELEPGDPEINNNYGWFLCQTGREKDAIVHFMRAIRNPLYQTPDRAYLNAGQCSQKMGDLAAADDYLQKALRFSRENPLVLLRLASVNYQLGKPAEAKKLLTELLRLTEPNAEVLWLALRVERLLGDRNAEVSFAAQLRRKFPASPETQALLKGAYE